MKVFASSDKGAQKKFIREVGILLALGEYKDLVDFIPKVYKYNLGLANGSLYYLLEYFDYKSFGEFTQDLGYRSGIFKKPTFEKFMDFWQLINTHCQGSVKGLSPYGLSRFEDELSFYEKNTPGILSSTLWVKVKNHLAKREKLINKCTVLSHLDLYPENIFVQKSFSDNFKIIDWEQSHTTALGCNEAFLYLMFWKEDFFRKKIFARIWEQEAMSTFKCFLLLFSVRFLYQLESFVDKENRFHDSFRRFLLSIINDILSGKFDRPKNLQYLLSKNLIKQILKNYYSIKKEIIVDDFPSGYGNTMVKITTTTNSDTNKGYVLRVYSLNRLAENIKREAKIYRYLSKKGFPTYFIYKNKERRLVSKAAIYGKERYFILTSFLAGGTVSRSKLKRTHVYQAGKWLAKIHMGGVVHNDYNRRNILYDNGTISGIIDMEFSRFTTKNADHLRDLAKAIALWVQGIDENASLTVQEVYRGLMEGYFGEDWKSKIVFMNKLVVEELRKLRTDYKKMYRESPSDYFEGIVNFINKLIPFFKTCEQL